MPRQPAQPGPTGRAVCPLTQRVAPGGFIDGRIPQHATELRATRLWSDATWTPKGAPTGGLEARCLRNKCQCHRTIAKSDLHRKGAHGRPAHGASGRLLWPSGFPGFQHIYFWSASIFLKNVQSASWLLCVSIDVPSVWVRGVWVGAFCAGKTSRPAP